MTIRARKTRAFMKMFLIIFVGQLLLMISFFYVRTREIDLGELLLLATIAGSFAGLFCSVVWTPKEISWDDEHIIIWTRFPGYGNYKWHQLEYRIPGMKLNFNSITIKFEGQLPYMISSFGYARADWAQFQKIIEKRRS